MNKQAAEKIATDYYTLGVQLALHQSGLVKEAALPKEVVKKLIQAPAAGLGAVGTAGPPIWLLGNADKFSTKIEHFLHNSFGEGVPLAVLQGALLSIGGAGAMAGAHLAGKGVDKAHSLLSRLRK